MTLTDLGYHEIKRSKNVKKYIYSSMEFSGYTSTAFHNYDIIYHQAVIIMI